MSERIALGLTGYSGTGKTTISNYLAKKHQFTVFEGSTLIRSEAAARGETLTTRASYEAAFRTSQKTRGKTWLSETLLATTGDRLLQAGLRAQCDLLTIKRAGGLIVALSCPPEICLDRLDTTNPKNPRTLEEYEVHQAIENTPDEEGYGGHTAWCLEHADFTIDTSKPFEETEPLLDAIIMTMSCT